MNTEIENIIRDYNYSELNPEQLASVKEWAGSEEEYATMRQIITSAPLLNDGVAPSPKLKASLMDTFAAAHATSIAPSAAEANEKSEKKVLFLWMRSAAAVAAILFVVFMIYPLFNSEKNNDLVADNKVTNKTEKKKESKASEENITNEVQEQEAIEGVTESPNELAENTIFADEVRDESISAANRFESPVDLESNTEAISPASSTFFTNVNSATGSAGADLNLGFTNNSTIDPEMVNDVISFNHSDRIVVADLPERSRQVMQEQPELFDLLHTSF